MNKKNVIMALALMSLLIVSGCKVTEPHESSSFNYATGEIIDAVEHCQRPGHNNCYAKEIQLKPDNTMSLICVCVR